MTAKELERLERIAVQVLAGMLSSSRPLKNAETASAMAVSFSLELIRQLDALKIPE